jgi:hypothetical protein
MNLYNSNGAFQHTLRAIDYFFRDSSCPIRLRSGHAFVVNLNLNWWGTTIDY